MSDGLVFVHNLVKSMARDSRSGALIMVVLGLRQAINVYRSTDSSGTSFVPTMNDGQPNFDDKDDINVVFAGGKFIDMQVTKAQTLGGLPGFNGSFCDNLGACNEKRVLATRTSNTGVLWSNDSAMRFPDADDPPELQFCAFASNTVCYNRLLFGDICQLTAINGRLEWFVLLCWDVVLRNLQTE